MLDNDLDLTALRAFRAVVRTGSFSGAALALQSPKSTVSKRVGDLEATLGVRLIERTTRQIRITAEGEVLAARADRLLSDAEDIRRAMTDSGSAPRGHLRIAVPALFGQMLMGRIGARFRARYPDITLECLFLDRPPDLVEEGFDGAIRFGPLEDSSLVARAIGRGQSVLAAAPGLPGLDRIKDPGDLANQPIVAGAPAWPGFCTLINEAGEERQITTTPCLMLGSQMAMRDAVTEGAGIGILSRFLIAHDLASGRLVQVLPEWTGLPKTLLFVYPSPQSVTARLRAFIDFVVAELDGKDGWTPCHGKA